MLITCYCPQAAFAYCRAAFRDAEAQHMHTHTRPASHTMKGRRVTSGGKKATQGPEMTTYTEFSISTLTTG